jgi:hypothetical protein
MKNDITLLIGTCDKYSYLWDNFVNLCNKYWQVNCDKIFAGETLQVKHKGYYTSMCGKTQWSNIIKNTIKNIKTEYVYFVLDDYYFNQTITEKHIEDGINFLKENDDANKLVYTSVYCEYYNLSHVKETFFKMLDNSDYLTTTQPAIWKKTFLDKCLKQNFNPWQFEIEGTNIIKGDNNKVYIKHTEDLYFNVVNKGQIINKWNFFKKMQNLSDFKLN